MVAKIAFWFGVVFVWGLGLFGIILLARLVPIEFFYLVAMPLSFVWGFFIAFVETSVYTKLFHGHW